jgi:manganese transport protein
MMKKIKFGPSVFITSTLISPGTVTMCLLAGANTGLNLLWVVIFSTIATIILQDMCIRLGYFTKRGLETSLDYKMDHPVLKYIVAITIFTAVIAGNAIFQSSNFAGSSLGIEILDFGIDRRFILIAIFIFCSLCFLKGSYDLIKNILIVLVMLMSVSFLLLALLNFPSLVGVLQGCLIPHIERADVVFIVGLVGTTLLTNNLYLHTSLVAHHETLDIRSLRIDGFFAIALSGMMSLALVILGSKAKGMGIANPIEMANVIGSTGSTFSKYLLGLGLCCAGLSSALTVPIVSGLVMAGLLGWKKGFEDYRIKSTMIVVLLIGFIIAITETKSFYITKIFQGINVVLLPFFIIGILWILNDRFLLKVHKNSYTQNLLAIFLVLITILLATKSIATYLQ